jgi:hypothetical protein
MEGKKLSLDEIDDTLSMSCSVIDSCVERGSQLSDEERARLEEVRVHLNDSHKESDISQEVKDNVERYANLEVGYIYQGSTSCNSRIPDECIKDYGLFLENVVVIVIDPFEHFKNHANVLKNATTRYIITALQEGGFMASIMHELARAVDKGYELTFQVTKSLRREGKLDLSKLRNDLIVRKIIQEVIVHTELGRSTEDVSKKRSKLVTVQHSHFLTSCYSSNTLLGLPCHWDTVSFHVSSSIRGILLCSTA